MHELTFREQVIHVSELDRSVRFYAGLLGFVELDRDEFMGQRMVHLSRPELRLFLLQEAVEIPPPEPFLFRVLMHFESRNGLDQAFQQFLDAGARIIQEPASTPWGEEAFVVADPDGYRVLVSGPRK